MDSARVKHAKCRCRLRLKIFKAPVLQIHMSYVVSMYVNVTCILYIQSICFLIPSCSIFSCGYPMSKDGNLSEDPGLEPNLEVWRCESKSSLKEYNSSHSWRVVDFQSSSTKSIGLLEP